MPKKLDISLKDLFKEMPVEFIGTLTPYKPLNLLNTDLTNTEHKPDILLELEGKRILHIEFQSTNDPIMPTRMLLYRALIMRKFRSYSINQWVIYVGEEKLRMSNKLIEDGIVFWFNQIDAREVPCDRLIKSEKISDKIIACLCNIQNPREYLVFILKELENMGEKESLRYKQILDIFMVYRKNIRNIFVKMKEELQMPLTINKKMLEQDELYQLGLKRGLEEGIEEGIEKGALLESQSLLINLVKMKFGGISKDLEDKIKAIGNKKKLENLIYQLIKIQSLEDFSKLI